MSRSKSNGYRVLISNNQGVEVLADLPEQFALGVSQMFESTDQAVSAGSFAPTENMQKALDSAFNIGAQVQAMSYAVWRGSSPIEFSLQLIFDAETNARQDVHNKLATLVWMSLPQNGSLIGAGMLTPPTPSQYNTGFVGADAPISCRIGRQFLFPSVAIVSANISTDTRMNNDMPIAGSIDITMRTIIAYGKDDWLRAASVNP